MPKNVYEALAFLILKSTFFEQNRGIPVGVAKAMRTIAVVNQKGGCGKTTISINLAASLAELGYKTLLVDMDPQSHCAVGLAVPEEQIEQSIYDVLISHSRNEPLKLAEILWQISEGFDLAPASLDLAAFEQQMNHITDRENCLDNVLAEVETKFDYVIIDCPPAVGLLTFNALKAATDVIVPVETGYFALHGLSRQLETLGILSNRTNHKINVKVLASMYDIRTKMARDILAELKAHFADKMFKSIINFNTKIKEAASFGQPVGEYNPTCKGKMDFKILAEEVTAAETEQQEHKLVNTLAEQLASISSSADELLESTKLPALQKNQIKTIEPAPKPEIKTVEPVGSARQKPAEMNEKLSDYYGANQINDAVVFVTLYPRAQKVQIAGDFNNWQPAKTVMQKVGVSGVWQTKLKLPKGKYHYRLVVDGQWHQDPYNESTELNPFGDYNSLLEVK